MVAVLLNALEDALYYRVKNASSDKERAAYSVFRRVSTNDFYEVCTLANIEPKAAKLTFKKVLQGSREDYERIKKLLKGKVKND